jgi:hypothetical protein
MLSRQVVHNAGYYTCRILRALSFGLQNNTNVLAGTFCFKRCSDNIQRQSSNSHLELKFVSPGASQLLKTVGGGGTSVYIVRMKSMYCSHESVRTSRYLVTLKGIKLLNTL